jgi:hypothetical protein
MRSKITFATFDPVFRETPRQCTACATNPPVFRYEFSDGIEEQEPEIGFCCLTCAPEILAKLAGAECRAWQEEEAALKAADVDVRELHQWRVAAFHR